MSQLEWCIENATDFPVQVVHAFGGLYPEDLQELESLGDRAREKNLEVECGPPREAVFELDGNSAGEARKKLVTAIRQAQALGCRIMRLGYGRLEVSTSRYNIQESLDSQLGRIESNLRLAMEVIEEESEDLCLAIENHCDFSGRELASVFVAIGNQRLGCALDTANSYIIFTDPYEDTLHLAPWALTTHLKDMAIVQGESGLPFRLQTGLNLGEGTVPLKTIVRLLKEQSPVGDSLSLILENWGLPKCPEGVDPLQHRENYFRENINTIRELIEDAGK